MGRTACTVPQCLYKDALYLLRRLRVFENRVLRRIFGPKGDEVTGEWKKLHNEELNPYPANVESMMRS